MLCKLGKRHPDYELRNSILMQDDGAGGAGRGGLYPPPPDISKNIKTYFQKYKDLLREKSLKPS